MNYKVKTTDSFERDAKRLQKKHPSLKEDVIALINSLETSPSIGDILGKDCYKIRIAIKSKGKGKRGGGRVITCVKIVNQTVYLLTIYDKSKVEDITKQKLTQLLRDDGL